MIDFELYSNVRAAAITPPRFSTLVKGPFPGPRGVKGTFRSICPGIVHRPQIELFLSTIAPFGPGRAVENSHLYGLCACFYIKNRLAENFSECYTT